MNKKIIHSRLSLLIYGIILVILGIVIGYFAGCDATIKSVELIENNQSSYSIYYHNTQQIHSYNKN